MEMNYFFAVFVTLFYKVNSLRCRSCEGVVEPRYCIRFKDCAAGELCYTEQVIDEYSNVFYNVGCKSSDLCAVAEHDGFGKRDQLHVCEKCCKYDQCNSDTCYHKNSTVLSKCLSCDDVAVPTDCQNTIQCTAEQICFTQEFVNDKLQKRYRLGCESRKRCDILHQLAPHRRSTQLCNQCCENPGCNKFLCPDSNIQSGTSVGTRVSTAGPTTKAATQAATKPPTTQTTRAATKTTPGGATKPCADSTIVKCAELDASGTLCSAQNPAAATYCPKYCNLC